jgi:voltage-gated potassium channel
MDLGIQEKVYDIIDTSHSYNKASRIFHMVMLAIITLNILAVIFETEPSIYQPNKLAFDAFEYFSIAVFTLEYVLRIWSCTTDPRFKKSVNGRLRYMLRPMAIIDLLAFLPFYVHAIFVGLALIDLRFIRAVRLFRLFRVFKMGEYSRSVTKLGNVIRKKKEELVITLFAGLILLVVASSLEYFVENEVQPEAFSSIPAALWWGVVTLTTVGYGDVYPETILGKLIAASMAFIGIGLFALPAGIIASGFISEIDKKATERVVCPHCGKIIEEEDEKKQSRAG